MTKIGKNLAGNSSQRYRAPTLKFYGAAIEMTASGTTPTGEGTGTGNIGKKG